MDRKYRTVVLSQSGRSGRIQDEDGTMKLQMSLPPPAGGSGAPPAGTTPEQLLAGALAACFEHSVRHIAKKNHMPLRGCYAECELGLYISFDDVYRIVIHLTLHLAGALSSADADFLLERAREVSPIAGALKNNVTLEVKAEIDTPVAA